MHMLSALPLLLLPAAACQAPLVAQDPVQPAPADGIRLERIMADPEWIQRRPEDPWWAPGGDSIWFRRKLEGSEAWETVHLALDGSVLETLPPEKAGQAPARSGAWSPDRRRRLVVRHGDLFVEEPVTNDLLQLTRTSAVESRPRFTADGAAVLFLRDGDWFRLPLAGGGEAQLAELRPGEEPPDPAEQAEKEDEERSWLARQQERLFEHVRSARERRRAGALRRHAATIVDSSRLRTTWLGPGGDVRRTEPSPDGAWLLVVLGDGGEAGRAESMPEWVTENGYVEAREVHSKVGTGTPERQSLVLVDTLAARARVLDLAELPGIAEDPLAALRQAAGQPELEGPRAVRIRDLAWNRDGSRALVQVFSRDRKDRWLAVASAATGSLTCLEHWRDEAWQNLRFAQAGWLPDGERLWFLSEETGWSHLYLRDLRDGSRTALTAGEWEASSVHLDPEGAWFTFLGNREHPGVHEVYRVAAGGGPVERVTTLGGENRFQVSPDGRQLLLEHSSALEPPDLWLQENRPGAVARRLTDTATEEFRGLPWVAPAFVELPSPAAGRPVYARLYLPPDPPPGRKPAVLFVHGAGYLQNAHQGWSDYFREFLFHSLLVHRGFVVLDMDYRASAGYGRDWRTAIYRRMGTPELEDLVAGVHWLVERHQVDPERVGLYGGSYGGFLTLMALFRRPEVFACGAALRPVTDWAHYHDSYTRNILNTPEVDPEAYRRSSPIEWAAGLEDPLLICHGMLDDNVFFSDTVRLAQRLIELGKEDWEVALYPVEPHGFREPASWLDEYRRILKLFESRLRP